MSIFKLSINARLALYLMLAGVLLAACNRVEKQDMVMLDGMTMGTTYSIQVVKSSYTPVSGSLSREIEDILKSVDAAMSTWREDSELSRINRMPASEWITVSPDLFSILEMAVSVSELSKGAFDATLDPIIELWGFSSNEIKTSIPANETIVNAMQQVGYQYLELDRQRGAIKKQVPIQLNLSAIAKGFAVDKIAEHLDEKGIAAYLIEVGGELRLKGNKPGGADWKIAIETPSAQGRHPHRLISITDRAIATSGDYRNYFEMNGKRYSHTIDPVTGYPVKHNLASVTIFDKNTAYADALATAVMVMGGEKGFQFCEQNKIPAYFIIKKNGEFVSRYTRYIEKYLIES